MPPEEGTAELAESRENLRLLFRDIVFRSRRLARRRLGNIGFTMSDLLTLAILEHRDRISVGDLASDLGVARATMSRILGRLEKAGHIRRFSDRTDRRRTFVRITLKGRRLRQRVGGFWTRMGSRMFEGFTPEQMERLQKDLRRIYQNVLSVQSEMEGTR